jgi:hypothetical protein
LVNAENIDVFYYAFVCVIVLSSLISACNVQQGNQQSSAQKKEDSYSAEWTRPETPIKISYMTYDFGSPEWNIASNNKPDSIKRVEARVKDLFNIKFEYEIGSGEAYDTMVTTRLAAVGRQFKYTLIIVSSLPIILVYPFLQKYFIKGALLGSLKE